MVEFKSVDEIHKFAGTSAGQLELLKMSNINIEKLLVDATKELEGYLKDGLQSYFHDYEPSGMYSRTGQTIDDIILGHPQQIIQGSWSISIDMNSPHNSLFGGEDGNTLNLINTGWKWSNEPVVIEHFSRFEGTNYVKNAIDKFNASNDYGMIATAYLDGEDISDKVFNYGN